MKLCDRSSKNSWTSYKISGTQISSPEIKVYEVVKVLPGVACDELFNAVKCLQEFTGTPKTYVSWSQAAQAAYSLFRLYEGSSRHYQAVLIIRSKMLSQFKTALNFDAIVRCYC